MSTKIDYLDETWSPVTGCTPISEGCKNCWAKAMTERFGESWGYDFTPQFHEDRLEIPFRWKRPRRIGVSFMGDLFHKDVTAETVARVWAVMMLATQHTFIVLTKRPERMLQFFQSKITAELCAEYSKEISAKSRLKPGPVTYDALKEIKERGEGNVPKNIWLGVSAENQEQADKRIPVLLNIPAAVRFVSVEPMLEKINLEKYLVSCNDCGNKGSTAFEANYDLQMTSLCNKACTKGGEGPSLDWLIIGAESGPMARKVDNKQVIDLARQGCDYNVPVFLKQAWINGKLVKMPNIGGQVWDQMPEESK